MTAVSRLLMAGAAGLLVPDLRADALTYLAACSTPCRCCPAGRTALLRNPILYMVNASATASSRERRDIVKAFVVT